MHLRSQAALLFSLVLFLFACGRPPTPVAGDLGRFVVAARASSMQNEFHPAEQAFDGDSTTRWSSVYQDGEWLEAQFDRHVLLDSVVIRWETARAGAYTLLAYTDGKEWVEAARYAATDSRSLTDTLLLFPSVACSAIRLRCDRRLTSWGNSVFEMRFYGRATGAPPARCLLGWKRPLTPVEERLTTTGMLLLDAARSDPATSSSLSDDAFLDLVERRAFDYFWHESDPNTGLTRDRAGSFAVMEQRPTASIAATGFALTAYAVGAERGWVSRADARARVLATLATFADGRVPDHHGFFAHFVDMASGRNDMQSEISTIDTVLLLCGVITAGEYFADSEVTRLTRRICERVDWDWARNGKPFVSMGLEANGRTFLPYVWGGVADEGVLLYLLALGSPTHPLSVETWHALERRTGQYEGYRFTATPWGYQSIFRFQYPNLWYDFRDKVDRSGLDYAQNLSLATLAMRAYCIEMSSRYPLSYGEDLWGLGAADGLGDRYTVYGFPPGQPPMDGTVVVYGIAGSLPQLPRHGIRALRRIYDAHHESWGKYGFTDAINPTEKFVTRDAIGLDHGTVLIGIENHRSGLVWRLFMNSDWIRRATAKIGWRSPAPGASAIDLALLDGWRFRAGDGDFAPPELDDRSWTSVPVPDRLNRTLPALKGWRGTGWYRLAFELDADRLAAWRTGAQPVTLVLGGVEDADAVWINGEKIGATPAAEGLRIRCYRIPSALLLPGRNLLAVRIEGGGGIWCPPIRLGPMPPRWPWALLPPGTAVPEELLAGMPRIALFDAAAAPSERSGVWEAEGSVVRVERVPGSGLRIRYDMSGEKAAGGFWIKPGLADASRGVALLVRLRGEGSFSPRVAVDLKAGSKAVGHASLQGVGDRSQSFLIPVADFDGLDRLTGALTEVTLFWTHADAPRQGTYVLDKVELLLSDG